MEFNIILDAIIAVLLVATIAYAVVLNRKLAALRNAKSDMEQAAARFAESMNKAGEGLGSLKGHAEQSGQMLQTRLDQARGLADDLAFLIEKGNSVVTRLDGAIGASRLKAADAGPPGHTSNVQDLVAATKPTARKGGPEQLRDVIAAPGGDAAAETTTSAPAAAPATTAAPEVSEAESALLKALQGMR